MSGKKNRVERQDGAKERQEEYNNLTSEQKIELLDKKLGKGVGAKKQRAKLFNQRNKIVQPKKDASIKS